MFGRVRKLIPACCEPVFQNWINLAIPHAQEIGPVFTGRPLENLWAEDTELARPTAKTNASESLQT